ncbi:protein transport protein Sec31A-like isoform X1 [Oculina patagonica]
MKVKEVNRTANIAWSPAPQYPIYLAAGTAAQQLDATFSTNAALEIFALNLSSSDTEIPLKGTVATEHRFHKLVWGSHGMESSSSSSGLLIGGSDNGIISIYDTNKIISGDVDDSMVFQSTKHTGPVQALDCNPFKTSLLASGASDSEIYIWDLTNPSNPLTPGSKTLPPDNISCVAWNRQVQHILASASPCGRCVVWDLRKNEPIIKVSDQSATIRCKAVEWHPDVATQMVLASEDDRYPVIQMWDLRFATSPMKVLEGHQRGILSIAWCPQDPDLLMSCAKDNRILCWNPNVQEAGGEIVYELPTTAQWSFDVAWCPRNPAMVCSSSFDGHVSVFSLMGGGASGQDFHQQQVMSSFDVDDPFSSQIHQAQQQQQQQQQKAASAPLKKPPKWLRRPCGATFAFGGKLISFAHTKESPASQVNISQVTTEQDLVNRSYELEGALASGSFIQYCNSKVESSTQELERTLWSFLKINFEREPRRHFLTLLGYDPVELSKKVASSHTSSASSSSQGGVNAEELVQKMKLLTSGDAGGKSGEGVFSSGASTPSVAESKTPLSESGSLSEAAAAFDVIAAGGPLSVDTGGDLGVEEPVKPRQPFQIPTDDDTDGLITQALLTGNFEAAVDVCLHADRMADAFLLAIAGGPDLLARIQTRYFEKSKSNVARLMSVVVNRDWRDIVESCVLENWREALAALVTYAKAEEFTALCDILGQRLEQEGDEHCANAMVCYICAGNVEKFVSCWSRNMPAEPSPLALQDLIEKVMILKKAVERERRLLIDSGSSVLAEKLSKYAEILAAQGCLETAMGYLMAVNDQASLGVLKDRLYTAQFPSHLASATAPPPFPFQRIDVQAEPLPQVQAQTQFQQQPGYGANRQQQQQQQQQQTLYQPQQRQQPSPAPSPAYQPSMPSTQTQFYNPAAYQPQAPQPSPVSQPSFNQGPPAQTPPAQTPYYSAPPQPSPTASQPSWSQPPPVSMYQPQPANTAPTQVPPPGQYGSQMQMKGQQPPVQIFNPGSTATPGAPYSGPSPTGAPSVGPPPPGTAAPPPTTGPPPTEPPPLTSAWKDTHMMRGKKQQTPAFTPPAPITAPLFGAGDQQPPQQQQPLQPSPVGMPQGAPPAPGVPPMMPQGGGPPGAPPSYGDAAPQQRAQVHDGSPPPSPHDTMPHPFHLKPAQEPPAPVMKGPIPSEHLVLQETFNGLAERCKNTANNPHTKRKLDDVSKRLEALYDKLRDQKMSNPILEGLHEIAQACQGSDYPRGLMAHTRLISSGSFSEISTFMPGLKSLMQIATQLRV